VVTAGTEATAGKSPAAAATKAAAAAAGLSRDRTKGRTEQQCGTESRSQSTLNRHGNTNKT
jgi:hypothetical protein